MITQLSHNIYVETGVRGCNHGFVVTAEGVVMIDTPLYPTDALKWREEIARFGPVRYIINTEPHHDHYCGNYFFEGTIIAHEGTRQAILGNPVQSYLDQLKQTEPSSLSLVKNYSFRPPTITMTDKMTLYLGQYTFQLINIPGHTPFQVPVYIPEEKILFTSDNAVNNHLPFITSLAMLPLEWMNALKQTENIDAKILIPGHGGVSDKTLISQMIAHLKAWMDAVADCIEKGMSLEETQDSINFLERYPHSTISIELMKRTQRENIATIYGIYKKSQK